MKVGMLPIWDKWGERHAVTVLQLDECDVVQVKREDTDGYVAMQLGVGEAKRCRVKISAMGHYKRADVKPKRKLMEFRVSPDSIVPEGMIRSASYSYLSSLLTPIYPYFSLLTRLNSSHRSRTKYMHGSLLGLIVVLGRDANKSLTLRPWAICRCMWY